MKKTAFFSGPPNFFGPSYFEVALVYFILCYVASNIWYKLYIPTISISKTSNKISLTSYYYKLLFWDTYIFLFHWSLTKVQTV